MKRIDTIPTKKGMYCFRAIRIVAAQAFLAFVFASSGLARIDRIDVFDKADNKLLFVTFQYAAAKDSIISRDVFTADSTFLRHTSFQLNAQNQIIKESSINFDSNLVFYTNINSSGTSSTFSVFDQFNVDQFGGAMSASASDQVSYDISQGGTVINKIKYTLVNGSVQRIDISDNTGAMLYYALPFSTQPKVICPDQQIFARRPAVAALGRGHFKITCDLAQSSNLILDLFNISGRRAAVVLNKRYAAGAHSILADAGSTQLKTIGNGAYIVRLSIDGKQVVSMVSIIQK